MTEELGIYIHIPFCKKRCSYCTFLSLCDFSLQADYFSALHDEIISYSKAYANTEIDTIYLGGGSPSCVEVQYLDSLFSLLKDSFKICQNAEITVECNAENLTEQKIHCLKKNGVNRVSLGLQSTSDSTLKKIGRMHSYEDFLTSVSSLQNAGITNLSADLIVGLPESKEEFLSSVSRVSRLPINHISMYALELHENTKLYDDFEKGKIFVNTDSDYLSQLYDEAREILKKSNFTRYEISNFCKQGFESKHNLKYWQNKHYFGFGAGASGYLGNFRYKNIDNVKKYIQAQPSSNYVQDKQQLTLSDKAFEFVMLGLRLDKGISLAEFSKQFKKDLFDFYPNATRLLQQKFLVQQNHRLFVPEEKMYVLNSILTELL